MRAGSSAATLVLEWVEKGVRMFPKSILMSLTWRERGGEGQGPFSPLPQDTGYWLRHCEGFQVDSSRRRLGVVECVPGEDALDGAEVVAVRTRGLRSRRMMVALDDVVEVRPSECRLIVLDRR
jgi:hypothetical protein